MNGYSGGYLVIIVVDIILTLVIALVWSFHSTGSQLKFMTSTSFAWFFPLREERERVGSCRRFVRMTATTHATKPRVQTATGRAIQYHRTLTKVATVLAWPLTKKASPISVPLAITPVLRMVVIIKGVTYSAPAVQRSWATPITPPLAFWKPTRSAKGRGRYANHIYLSCAMVAWTPKMVPAKPTFPRSDSTKLSVTGQSGASWLSYQRRTVAVAPIHKREARNPRNSKIHV